jgi:hypothetical protein
LCRLRAGDRRSSRFCALSSHLCGQLPLLDTILCNLRMTDSNMIPQDSRILETRFVATTARANEEMLRLNVPHQPLTGSKARMAAAYPLASVRVRSTHMSLELGIAGESL